MADSIASADGGCIAFFTNGITFPRFKHWKTLRILKM
jgi:hypothetical protein